MNFKANMALAISLTGILGIILLVLHMVGKKKNNADCVATSQ